jgi:hypothetical protein
LKRVIKILGIKGLLETINAWTGLYDGQADTVAAIS